MKVVFSSWQDPKSWEPNVDFYGDAVVITCATNAAANLAGFRENTSAFIGDGPWWRPWGRGGGAGGPTRGRSAAAAASGPSLSFRCMVSKSLKAARHASRSS